MIDRHAGLARANQRRRGSMLPEARLSTPASQLGERGESEPDDGFDDAASELMPDDSASNISSSRRRRHKRRHERMRTPALVEEEDEDGGGSAAGKWR